MVTTRFTRFEARQTMSQTYVAKIIARTGLLLLVGFAGVGVARAQAIEQKVAVCKACHVTGTLQSTSVIPNIWGQSEGYVYIQLRDFKSGARNAPEDAAMRGFAATMSDADMLEIAEYASTQPWPKVEPISTDAALLKQGAYATALVGCGGCHFNDWKGFSANPRIGDQTTAYLAATIRQFRTGSRANSPGMSDLARTFDEGDVEAVAAYLNAAQ
jgi:cytochrome c553